MRSESILLVAGIAGMLVFISACKDSYNRQVDQYYRERENERDASSDDGRAPVDRGAGRRS